MNKKVIRLTESDLVRIIKKVISEQPAYPTSKPSGGRGPSTTPTVKPPTSKPSGVRGPSTTPAPISFTNKSIDIYEDAKHTKFYKKIRIKSTNVSPNGEVILTIRADGDEYLKFKCSKRASFEYFNRGEDTSEYTATVFNTTVTAQLAKTYCTVSSGGASVPKADYTVNSSDTGKNFA
jgi:hypothetical protein